MIYLFSVAAGLVGGFAAVLLLSGRRPRRRKEGKQNRRKTECSKLVLWAVLCTYFAGFGVGVWAVVLDASQLGVSLPTLEHQRQRSSAFIRGKQRRKTL